MAKRRPLSSPNEPTLFGRGSSATTRPARGAPLADAMRPSSLDDLVGQGHLVGPGKWLGEAIAEDRVTSIILWGPPGSGKTTLAQIVAQATKARFVPFSAVLGGVPELRVILAEARTARAIEGARTILFIDE